MTRAAKKAILALLVASITGTIVHAQSRQGDPIRFSLKVGAEYTDNRDSLADGEDNTDIWTRPRLDAIVDWDRGALNFYYEPAFRYRTDPNDVQNYTELYHDIAAVVNHDINPKLSLNVNERFAYTDDPAVQRGGTTLRRDSSYLMNWAGLGAKWKVRPRTVLGVNGTHNLKRYDESEVAIESDEDRSSADLSLSHYVAPTLAFSIVAKADDVDYEHSDGIDRDYVSSSAGLGVDKILGKTVRGSARAGYMSLDYDSDDVPSDDSPYFGIDVRVEPMPTRRFIAGVTYELRESYAYPHASQEYSGIHGAAEFDLGPHFTLKIGAKYRVGDYDLETVPADALARVNSSLDAYQQWIQHFVVDGKTSGEEKAIVTTLEAAYKIDKNTSLALTHRYEDVDSDVRVTFDRNAVGLVLTRNF